MEKLVKESEIQFECRFGDRCLHVHVVVLQIM